MGVSWISKGTITATFAGVIYTEASNRGEEYLEY